MSSNTSRGLHEIAASLAAIGDAALIRRFLESLLTPREREEIAGRWELVKLLERGESQRHVAKRLGMSLCKITRGSRELKKRDSAFKAVLDRVKQRPTVRIPGAQVSIEARIQQLLARLSETEACGFEDLFEDASTRQDLIVTFLALLEMIRTRLVKVFQAGMFGAIRVYRRAQG